MKQVLLGIGKNITEMSYFCCKVGLAEPQQSKIMFSSLFHKSFLWKLPAFLSVCCWKDWHNLFCIVKLKIHILPLICFEPSRSRIYQACST